MSNIALIGPGAIGGTVTAWLAQDARHTLTVATRIAIDRLEVDTPYGAITARPRVLTEASQAEPVDWILIASKAYDAPRAAAWLHGFRGNKTLIAVLQNGVEHISRFAPYAPVASIVPVMVDCPALRVAPGRMRQLGPARLVVPQGPAGAAFVDLFVHTKIAVAASPDINTELWRKLCINSAGAVSAVLLTPAIVARHEGVAEIMRGIVRECVAVGRAEGATLADTLPDDIVARTRSEPPDAINSLHADRLAGRPMEVDARNGAIVRLGRKHGIDTPLNAMMVALLEAVQR
jgi:2-dehydropantoate 2-reductase